MFKKFKQKFKRFMTGKSGFSLVELIVVIAIMAVMAAVLAPALLGYVERSRAQKDDSAFDEVVNSVQLSLADQDVYDEMLMYSAEQYSCYVDSDSPDEANKVDIKAGKYYMYNDNERQLDETVYKLDGVMRGVTITFAPDAAASNSATLDLVKGHVNKYLPSGKKTYGGLTGANASPQLSAIVDSELYNSLRATIGDKIAISSQTYRNSEYTIFISMGTTGGQEAAAQDAIKVWGQWSGTNLPEGSSIAANGATSGTNAGSNEFQGGSEIPVVDPMLNPNGIIPEGAMYVVDAATVLCEGESFPEPKTGDVYYDGNVEYKYNYYEFPIYSCSWDGYDTSMNGWGYMADVNYSGKICQTIAGKPVIDVHALPQEATYYQGARYGSCSNCGYWGSVEGVCIFCNAEMETYGSVTMTIPKVPNSGDIVVIGKISYVFSGSDWSKWYHSNITGEVTALTKLLGYPVN